MADSTTKFGFVAFAETWNGRLAMLGFVIGLGTELLTGQGILGQIGLEGYQFQSRMADPKGRPCGFGIDNLPKRVISRPRSFLLSHPRTYCRLSTSPGKHF